MEIIPCWRCDGNMHLQKFKSCFGETSWFYECGDCHFTLDKGFVDEFGYEKPSSEWATPHYVDYVA